MRLRKSKKGSETDPMESGFSVTWIIIVLVVLLALLLILSKRLDLSFLFGR